MSLTSINYILFLLASVVIYYLMPGKIKSHIILLASLVFYVFFSPEKLLILMLYIWVIYILGVIIGKQVKFSHLVTVIGVILSIAVLASLRVLSSLKMGALVPIGISYCVLQSIAYLCEVNSGRLSPVKSPVDLFTYLLFFPKLLAGPVEDPSTFLTRLENATFSINNINKGIPLIGIGLAKKLAVAEVLSPVVALVFDSQNTYSGTATLIGIICYSFVILFDFSGYTDIALGSSLLFGIEITDNFNNPYLSVGIIDFWKRWHISLTSWLRTYVYIPLGGSRVSKTNHYLNIITVFLISGIWHGSSITYLVWGLYHSLLQILELVFRNLTGINGKDKKLPLVFRPFIMLSTFVMVTIGWVFFRAANLNDAISLFESLANPWTNFSTALEAVDLSVFALIFTVASILITTILKAIVAKKKLSLFPSCIITACALLITVLGLVLVGTSANSTFIYFNF